eukprot:CCRYP_020444-RB/>CCRYP_020444-RB protein AED:0.16 eAED:0.16 QI:183/1/1/1/0.15/0.07/14/4653/338
MEASIPRRVRAEDLKDKPEGGAPSKNASGDPQNTSSLLAGMAPPPAVAVTDASKRLKPSTSAPIRRSPVPSGQSPSLHSSQITSSASQQQQMISSSPTVSAALSDVENRTIRHLDKFIDVVSSSLKTKRSASSASSSALLDRIAVVGGEGAVRRESNKRSGAVDLFGSFLTTSSNRHDFFVTDPHTSAPIIPPLPSSLPIFPEDFPPNGPKEWPLSWWGIVQPSNELLAMHERVAEEVGYPIGKRMRVGAVDTMRASSLGGGDATNDDANKSKTNIVNSESNGKEKESSQRDRSGGSKTGDDRNRQSRNRDERRHRDQRHVDDGTSSRGRRSLDRRRS